MKKKEPRRGHRSSLESQDDIGYLTGRRSPVEEEKQVKSPSPRRARKDVKPTPKDEEGDLHQR